MHDNSVLKNKNMYYKFLLLFFIFVVKKK